MKIEDRMTNDELRREVRRAWDLEHALSDALRDLPAMPSTRVLNFLGASGTQSDWVSGKFLQRSYGPDVIPYRSECETGAGVWARIRAGLALQHDRATGYALLRPDTPAKAGE